MNDLNVRIPTNELFRVNKDDSPTRPELDEESLRELEAIECPLKRTIKKKQLKRKKTHKDPLTGKVIVQPIRSRRKKGEYIDPDLHIKIIKEYVDGKTTADISKDYRLSTDYINRIITSHWENLTNLREARLLQVGIKEPPKGVISCAYTALDKIHKANKGLNKEFLDLLSGPTDPTLTEPEIQFALLYVATGSGTSALTKAGLNIGIIKAPPSEGGSKGRGERLAKELRCTYLKNKPNIAEYINQLRTEKYLPQAVDLQFIQTELLEQLSQCKEDDHLNPRTKKQLLLRIVDTLGKTIGAFSDRLQVEHINPGEALDYLATLNSANKATTTELIELTPESVESVNIEGKVIDE